MQSFLWSKGNYRPDNLIRSDRKKMASKSILGVGMGSAVLIYRAKMTKCSRKRFILILPRSTPRLVYFPISVGESLSEAKKSGSLPIL